MNIKINGITLDVSLEKEKYVGEILSEIAKWLSDSGHVLSGLSVDGKEVSVSKIEDVFKKEISSVEILDIKTETVAFLTSSSLASLLEDIKKFENLNYEEKTKFYNNWKESACANFIKDETPELFTLCENTFLRGELSCQILTSIAEERLREVDDPDKEFANIEPILNNICDKLVDLPLDIQTGKETQAAQTIQLFTAVTEKILRIYYQLDIQGYFIKRKDKNTSKNKEQADSVYAEQLNADNEKIIEKITEFTSILQELFTAYQKNDSVLVGDLAEYEASVRIKEIYTTIMSKIQIPDMEKQR